MKQQFDLILPAQYFARYREHIGAGKKAVEAWQAVENELFEATGFARYASFDTFRHGLGREKLLIESSRISLLNVKVDEKK